MANLLQAARRLKARVDPARATVIAMVFAIVTTAVPLRAQERKGPKGLNAEEYEGWRQYSDKCARCHGQDALPNPVAANLLESLAPGGPMHNQTDFVGVVTAGRTGKGMPPFGKTLEPDQVKAIYSYLVGRASKRISPGRPERPGA
jgi:mono/diheme cytochrome c family protein